MSMLAAARDVASAIGGHTIGNWQVDHECLFTHQVDRKQYKTWKEGLLRMGQTNAFNHARRGGDELLLVEPKTQRTLATY